MFRYLFILLLPLTLFSQIEEKRLALVIGNSNYDKGPLNNPVNDALLMARTLDSLDFDVILDTNIANKENFIRTIREFGDKRPDYDVAFVYYAGHGIQVGAENFLLPTKVNFEKEYDVMDYGVSVQNIMRYLTGMTNQVNILVLDACRDNPFEGNWNKTRSLKGGGLAKIPPPTGSLIAFSTDAGNTAADGDRQNSVYCRSLCKNMKLSDISLDQVFRNVRSDVLKQTNGNQRPVEASQLTGKAYYLNIKEKLQLINEINFLIDINNINEAKNILNKFSVTNKTEHFYLKAQLRILLKNCEFSKASTLIEKNRQKIADDKSLSKIVLNGFLRQDKINEAKELLVNIKKKNPNLDSELIYISSRISNIENDTLSVIKNLNYLLSKNYEFDIDKLINIANHYYLLEDTVSMNNYFKKALSIDLKNINTHIRYILCNHYFFMADEERSLDYSFLEDFVLQSKNQFSHTNFFDVFLSEFYFFSSLNDNLNEKQQKDLLEKCINHANIAINFSNNSIEALQMRSAAYTNLMRLTESNVQKSKYMVNAIYDKRQEWEIKDKINYIISPNLNKNLTYEDAQMQFYFLGQIYYNNEEYELAKIEFEKGVKLAKKNNETPYYKLYNLLVLCNYNLDLYDETLLWINEKLDINPSDINALHFKSFVLRNKEMFIELESNCKKILEIIKSTGNNDDLSKIIIALNVYIFNNNYTEALYVLENFNINDDFKKLYKSIILTQQSKPKDNSLYFDYYNLNQETIDLIENYDWYATQLLNKYLQYLFLQEDYDQVIKICKDRDVDDGYLYILFKAYYNNGDLFNAILTIQNVKSNIEYSQLSDDFFTFLSEEKCIEILNNLEDSFK